MAYCVAGITSCFIATFTSVAATQGKNLTKLNVNTACMINFAKTFDVADTQRKQSDMRFGIWVWISVIRHQ